MSGGRCGPVSSSSNLFPTWESLLAQVAAAAVFVIGSYYLAEYQHKREQAHRETKQPRTTTASVVE